MPRIGAPMQSFVFRTTFLAIAATGLTMWGDLSSLRAQDDVIKTTSTKSEVTDKPPIDEAHPLYKLLEVAYKSRKALETVVDYKCVFTKREVLPNNKLLKTTMNLRLRESPFSVYLKFVDLNAGREVIYVEGLNNNNMLVHEAGLKSVLGTFPISPNGPDALAENKYPVSRIGLRKMLNTVITQWENEGKFAGITTQKYPDSKLSGQICTVYEAVHKQPFKEFKFHTTRLWIDDETGLAIGVQQYNFPGKHDKDPAIAEEYFYSQLKTNVQLTDKDFDPRNPSYSFR